MAIATTKMKVFFFLKETLIKSLFLMSGNLEICEQR